MMADLVTVDGFRGSGHIGAAARSLLVTTSSKPAWLQTVTARGDRRPS